MKSKDNIIKYGLLTIVLFFASTLLIQKISGYDIWWHLRTGQYIIEHKSVPSLDPFSYTASDRTWVNHQWLADVIMYSTYRLSGFKGLILLKTVIYFSAFGLLFMLSYKKKYPFLSMLLIVLGILAVSLRFFIRPFIFNVFFLSAYLYLLMRYKYDNKRLIFFIPLLHLFWANIHGGYLTGIVLIAAFLIGEGITWKLKIPFLPEDPYCLTGKKYRLLFYIFTITCLVTFINPKGISGGLYPIATLLELNGAGYQEVIMKYIGELQPTITRTDIFSFGLHSYYKLLLLIAWASLALNIKRLQLTHLIILSVFSFFSITSNRNVLTFAVVAVPIAMFNLDDFLSRIRPASVKRIIHSMSLNVVLFIPMGIFLFNYSATRFTAKYLIDGKIVKSSGFGFNKWRYPFDAIDFIQKNNIPGNMLNSYESGGAVIWKTYPERKVFIDGRTEVYNPRFFRDYTLMSYETPGIFEEFAEKYNINFSLLIHSPRYGEEIIKYLFASREWKLIYFDYVASVFLRDTPENAELLKRFEIKNNAFPREKPPPAAIPPGTIPYSSFRRAEFFRLVGLYDNAILEYENTLRIDPELPIPRNSMGLCYYRKGDLQKAEQVFNEVIKIAPEYPLPYNNLGNAYQSQGLIDRAIEQYKIAIKLNPDFSVAYYNLGNAYQSQGLIDRAIEQYKTAIRLAPAYTDAHYNLGNAYKSRGLIDRAIEHYQTAIKLNPAYTDAHYNLGNTYMSRGLIDRAIEHYQAAIRLNPDYLEAHNNLGGAYKSKGLIDRAIEQYIHAIRLQPTNAIVHENLGNAYRRKGMLEKAEEHFSISKRLSKDRKE